MDLEHQLSTFHVFLSIWHKKNRFPYLAFGGIRSMLGTWRHLANVAASETRVIKDDVYWLLTQIRNWPLPRECPILARISRAGYHYDLQQLIYLPLNYFLQSK